MKFAYVRQHHSSKSMELTLRIVDQINELIEINNDRIARLEQVIHHLCDEDYDLKTLFLTYIEESKQINRELSNIIGSRPELETGGTFRGTMYRLWKSIKMHFTIDDRMKILLEAERRIERIQRIYQGILNEPSPQDLVDILSNQLLLINDALTHIRALIKMI